MASQVELLKDPKKRKVQQTLLQYGISPKSARATAEVELRNWSSEQLSAIFRKLARRGPGLLSFEFSTSGLLSGFQTLVLGDMQASWLKPPPEMMKRSAAEDLALCVNASGKWALLKEGYFAISHVWEEGIQADPNNRGMPLAHIQVIIDRIKQTGAEWIWLDGLAIPASNRSLTLHEEELKIAIINNLASTYRRAKAVIILDALVMQLQSKDLLDVAVCLICGKWLTRVWTYQEICLARKALIITSTGIVDFKDMARKLRALSGLERHLPNIFGSDNNPLDKVVRDQTSSDKYEELYLSFARLLLADGKTPSVTQLAMACHNRKTGNDIDYARAFFPILGLTWKSHLTREEGMELIFLNDEQRWYAKRLLLMPGSPRSSVRPGWAPSYLTGLEGRPIGPEDPLGDIEWEKRGLRRKWYTYKVKTYHQTSKQNGLLLELTDENAEGILCDCELSINERAESIDGYRSAINRSSAYILSNEMIKFPSKYGMAYNAMFVERDEEYPDMYEAWVYLTAAITVLQRPLVVQATPWLILHESPISTHDRSGKDFSKIARLLSDEEGLHKGQGPLHSGEDDSDERILRQLSLTTSDIESRDEKGWTPLHVAAFKGYVKRARLLLEHGATIDALDNSERSPLMVAADAGHEDVVRELLQHGADVNLSSPNALCPLNQALLTGRIATVKALLEYGANPNGRDKYGFAPMLFAVNDLQLVDLLIAAGADPTSHIQGGATILHFAARAGNIPLIERLLALDMPVDLTEGDTVDGITSLYRAIEEKQEACVKILLLHGANPNHPINTTWTCALCAAKMGQYEIMKALVQHGADAHGFCTPEKWTALHIACKEGHRLIVRLLLDKGWEVNVKDNDGATPLRLATMAGHTSIVEILKHAGGI